MKDEPDIIKELREVEKLGGLWTQTTDNIAEFEVVEETSEGIPDKSVGFVEGNVGSVRSVSVCSVHGVSK